MHKVEEIHIQNIPEHFPSQQILEMRQALIRPKAVELSPKQMNNSSTIGLSPMKKKELPQLKLKNHGRLRSMRQRPAWNDRFFIEGVTNLTPAHPYFKVYSLINLFSNTLTSLRSRLRTRASENSTNRSPREAHVPSTPRNSSTRAPQPKAKSA